MLADRRLAAAGLAVAAAAMVMLALWAPSGLGLVKDDADNAIGEENSEPPSMPDPAAVVDDIEAIADMGYRKIDTVPHANAGDFIQFRLEDLGYQVKIQQFNTSECGYCRNYLVEYEGANPDSWIVVGGHYDAICYSQDIVVGIEYPGCTSEGAYDDATGVASVLEMARLMMDWGGTPEHTWIFVLFDYEEWQGSGSSEGGGMGSLHFVEALPEGVEIATYINLDMFGLNWPVTTNLASQLSGCDEEYFFLYLFTSPITDWSYYTDRGVNVTDEMREEAGALQDRLNEVLHDDLSYPEEWVTVLDDTKGNSDHYNFITHGVASTWLRGMHEFIRESGDTCEQTPKHAPTDRMTVLLQLAGGRAGLEAGMQTGLDALALLMWKDVQGDW